VHDEAEHDRVARFLALLSDVRTVRERLAEAEGARFENADGSARRLLRQAAMARLSQLEHSQPDLFAAASYYLDEVESPYVADVEAADADEHTARLGNSVAGRIGRFLEPALTPLGFDWRIGTAFIGAMAAREAFIAQMNILFAVGGHRSSDELQARLHHAYPPLTGFNIMLFLLIGSPCLPALVVTYRESRSWKWPAMQIAGLTLAAYVTTLIVHSLGTLAGVGTTVGG
jgi:ferrous iron transport protein B